MRDLPVLKFDLKTPEKFGNLAEKLEIDERRKLASDLSELIKVDENSMSDWVGKAKGYLDKVKGEGNDAPTSNQSQGSNEEDPPSTEMTLSAVIQFSARATDALLGEPDLARASEEGGEALASWVSSQLRTKDQNWTKDTDPLVVHMGVTGLSWRKREFDDEDRVFHSYFLTSTSDVIINKNVRSVERAPRITHQFERYPYEIERSIERKKWIDFEPRYDDADPQAPKKFYEIDAWLDLDGDEIAEPWTVVISRDDTPEVIRIKPRWSKKTVVDTDDALFFNAICRYYPYDMLPDPEGGFFPMGFGRLLDRTESSANRMLGSIVDTAKSESENGGVLAGGGFGLPDKIELQNDRVTTLNTDGAPLANHFSAFPVKAVSPGSVSVLEKLMQMGDRLAGGMNLMDNAPASMTATMAKGIIDGGTRVQSAIHRRLVASMTQEFRMFVRMADAYDMLPTGMTASSGEGVAVTADPQLATEMQRTAMAGIYMEMLKAPTIFIPQVTGLAFLKIMRVPNAENFIAAPQAPQATPWEKMQGYVKLMREQNEQLKTKSVVALNITQALKNMVEASAGLQGNRLLLLQMAQLENNISSIIEGSGNVGSGLDGMAQQPGNQNPAGVPAQPQIGDAPGLSGGAAGGSDQTGAGGGAA